MKYKEIGMMIQNMLDRERVYSDIPKREHVCRISDMFRKPKNRQKKLYVKYF